MIHDDLAGYARTGVNRGCFEVGSVVRCPSEVEQLARSDARPVGLEFQSVRNRVERGQCLLSLEETLCWRCAGIAGECLILAGALLDGRALAYEAGVLDLNGIRVDGLVLHSKVCAGV